MTKGKAARKQPKATSKPLSTPIPIAKSPSTPSSASSKVVTPFKCTSENLMEDVDEEILKFENHFWAIRLENSELSLVVYKMIDKQGYGKVDNGEDPTILGEISSCTIHTKRAPVIDSTLKFTLHDGSEVAVVFGDTMDSEFEPQYFEAKTLKSLNKLVGK
jgi:hypothetical protein